MNIDWVVISSDEKPTYADYYHFTASQWRHLGFKVCYVKVAEEPEEIAKTEYGLKVTLQSVEGVSPVLQGQIARLYAARLLPPSNMLISDIDMIPVNAEYFRKCAEGFDADNFLLYSGQPYGVVPYYPMCYVLGNTNHFIDVLEIDQSFKDFALKLRDYHNSEWNTDEKYMYDKLVNYKNKFILKRRFDNRIDKSWPDIVEGVDKIKLCQGYYVDAHLPVPYSDHKDKVNELVNLINNFPSSDLGKNISKEDTSLLKQ